MAFSPPFGMLMPERSVGSANYRYAFNGMEVDNEVSGNGNSYTTEFRQYDPRLGRWKSLDPLMGKFPWMSPYVAFDNNPVYYTDPLGLCTDCEEGGEKGETYIGDDGVEHTVTHTGADAPASGYSYEEKMYEQPLQNHKTPEGGTITVPNKSYEQFDKNGALISFSVYGEKFSYSTRSDGSFDGYQNKDGDVYQGKGVINRIPFYYKKQEYTDSNIPWPVYDDPEDGHSEWGLAMAETVLIRTSGYLIKNKLLKKIEKGNPLLKGADFPITIELEKITVESRTVYQYATSRSWYGMVYFNILNGYSYIIPTGTSNAQEVRVGVAKIQYRVLYNGIPTGLQYTDEIPSMELPSKHLPPNSSNPY